MKNLLTLYLVIFTSVAFGQSVSNVKKDTLKKGKSDKIVIQSDSASLYPIETKYSPQVIVLKEKGSEDSFKYILPIFTLLLGIVINKTLDYLSDKKKVKKAGKRWLAEIRCLESPIRMQIEVLEAYLKFHDKETFETYNLATYSILNCEIFKSLDKGDLLKYLQFQSKTDFKDVVKASNNVHGYISILTYWYETLKSDFESYKAESSGCLNSFNNNLQYLLREFADYSVQLENDTRKDPFLNKQFKSMADLISKYLIAKEYDVFLLEKEFFLPMLAILGDLRLDFRTKNLANYTSFCLNDIKAIRLEKQYFKENLTTIISNYKKQLVELEMIINTIENKN